jgi:hypothetical protein
VPITMPAPANAPKMPSTRPRTNGVPPMYFQPSTNWRNIDVSAFFSLRWRWPSLISLMPKKTTAAVAAREKALIQSAICTGSAQSGRPPIGPRTTPSRAASARAARIGVMPYVVISVSWLETSRRPLGIRLGTAASLAGIHIRVTVSPMKVAMTAQVTMRPPESLNRATTGIEPYTKKRRMSQMTMV